jgi:hypothetical protein
MNAGIAAIGIQGPDGLHGQALLAEIEDHAAGHAVKAGEDRPVDLMSNATASFREHDSAWTRAFPDAEIIYTLATLRSRATVFRSELSGSSDQTGGKGSA